MLPDTWHLTVSTSNIVTVSAGCCTVCLCYWTTVCRCQSINISHTSLWMPTDAWTTRVTYKLKAGSLHQNAQTHTNTNIHIHAHIHTHIHTHIQTNTFTYTHTHTHTFIYSKISLDWPFMGVNSCGPFREVVDLQNFPKYGKDTILLFLFCEKPVDIGKG